MFSLRGPVFLLFLWHCLSTQACLQTVLVL